MADFPYALTGPIGQAATLGLIVLQVDETIEQDFRRIFAAPDVAVYVSRIPSGDDLTADTIRAMEAALPQAASLLPPAARFDVIAYACTSGTALIGANAVTALVSGNATTQAVTNPLTAAVAALQALQISSVGIVSPYIAPVSGPIKRAFEDAGFAVPQVLSFGEEVEAKVARIDPASIKEAAMKIGQSPDVDAVFLSCTNLRTLDIIDDLENALGKPVITSNQALAWHMAQLSNAPLPKGVFGRLFTT